MLLPCTLRNSRRYDKIPLSRMIAEVLFVKNVIFDMGNVLLRYDPAYFLRREGVNDPADAALLMREIFRSPRWPMQDWGMLDEPDLEREAFARLPARLHEAAHRLIWSWEDPVVPIPGMEELLYDLKNKGYGLYLLSNASRRLREYAAHIPGSALFDGMVVSAEEGLIKPMPEIYACLCRRYGLLPEDCIFIDDMPMNIAGALRAGMQGIVFEGDAALLRRQLDDLLGSPAQGK